MKIETQEYNEVTVVELQGEFTEEAEKAFQDRTSSIIASGAACVVLDMTNVGFIDGHSLEQILWLKDYCHQNNRQLKLAGLDENCTKILEITRLLAGFDIYSELAEAVKSFA